MQETVLNQPVFPQFFFFKAMSRAKAFQKSMELRAMVGMTQVAKLMEDHVVPQILRDSD